MNKPFLSIVSPIYRGEKMLDELVSRIEQSVSSITDNFEIILVNDASPDNSWQRITEICTVNKHVKGVDLSKNFGQHPAISAGFSVSNGEWVIVLDCDLQDRPEEIGRLYAKAQEGYDIVFARRVHRTDKFLKRMSSVVFHIVYDWLSGLKTDNTIGNFGIYHHRVIEEIVKIPDLSRGFGNLLYCVGFKHTAINVEHAERAEGSSSYSLSKLLKLAFDNIIANSNKPLRMAISLGLIMSIISFILALYNVIAKIAGFIVLPGFTTTIFSIWFVGGLVLLVLGIIGIYIGRIYDQVKGHPFVVIRKVLNNNE